MGNILVGTLGGLWEVTSHANFFALHALLAFGPFLAMLVIARPLGRLLARAGQAPPAQPPVQVAPIILGRTET